ncbi:hypothetical protein [Phormidium tenue]|jgi:hypothetical protein|uniref:Uncharacterized protein n=1 Tax=Phormidium tenue FACHB-1050 TaxID=2692857 RepID=A0ABR8C8T4_9CYAN|nr:hypothetical protein [Phormidium tenue]MBD2316678.1 hypothetical protein [Phormidium tenue FACHB-1050]
MANLNVDYPAYPSIEFSEKDFSNSLGSYYAYKKIAQPIKGVWEADVFYNQGELVDNAGWAFFLVNGVFQKLSIASCRKLADGNYNLCVCI